MASRAAHHPPATGPTVPTAEAGSVVAQVLFCVGTCCLANAPRSGADRDGSECRSSDGLDRWPVGELDAYLVLGIVGLSFRLDDPGGLVDPHSVVEVGERLGALVCHGAGSSPASTASTAVLTTVGLEVWWGLGHVISRYASHPSRVRRRAAPRRLKLQSTLARPASRPAASARRLSLSLSGCMRTRSSGLGAAGRKRDHGHRGRRRSVHRVDLWNYSTSHGRLLGPVSKWVIATR